MQNYYQLWVWKKYVIEFQNSSYLLYQPYLCRKQTIKANRSVYKTSYNYFIFLNKKKKYYEGKVLYCEMDQFYSFKMAVVIISVLRSHLFYVKEK